MRVKTESPKIQKTVVVTYSGKSKQAIECPLSVGQDILLVSTVYEDVNQEVFWIISDTDQVQFDEGSTPKEKKYHGRIGTIKGHGIYAHGIRKIQEIRQYETFEYNGMLDASYKITVGKDTNVHG